MQIGGSVCVQEWACVTLRDGCHQRALRWHQRRDCDRYDEGRALNRLGTALQQVRRFAGAITACRAYIAICQETGDRHGAGITLVNLGRVLREAGRGQEALPGHPPRSGPWPAPAPAGPSLSAAGRSARPADQPPAVPGGRPARRGCRRPGARRSRDRNTGPPGAAPRPPRPPAPRRTRRPPEILRHRAGQLELRLAALEERQPP
jgi:hypothetical protein